MLPVKQVKLLEKYIGRHYTSIEPEYNEYSFGREKIPFPIEYFFLYFLQRQLKDRKLPDRIHFVFKYAKRTYTCKISFHPDYEVEIQLEKGATSTKMAVPRFDINKYSNLSLSFDNLPSLFDIQDAFKKKNFTFERMTYPLAIIKTNFVNNEITDHNIQQIKTLSKTIDK